MITPPRLRHWRPAMALTLAALMLPSVVAAQTPGQSVTPVTLQSAIADGRVEVSFSGLGLSSGDAIFIRVRKTPKAGSVPLALTIPPGSILRSQDLYSQSMVVSGISSVVSSDSTTRPASQITLSGGAPVGAVVRSYCTEFEKENPSASTRFAIEKPDPFLACIMRQGHNLSTPGLQSAVWIRTSGITYDQANKKFPVKLADWAAAGVLVESCRLAVEPSPPANPPGTVEVTKVFHVPEPSSEQASPATPPAELIANLKSMRGDLGIQSGLIATNPREVEALARLATTRDYWAFQIGDTPAQIAGVTIYLLNSSRFTDTFSVRVLADDKATEKTDRHINMPLQFYTSAAREPFEIVVNRVDPGGITGYLSAPKTRTPR